MTKKSEPWLLLNLPHVAVKPATTFNQVTSPKALERGGAAAARSEPAVAALEPRAAEAALEAGAALEAPREAALPVRQRHREGGPRWGEGGNAVGAGPPPPPPKRLATIEGTASGQVRHAGAPSLRGRTFGGPGAKNKPNILNVGPRRHVKANVRGPSKEMGGQVLG